MRMSGRSCVCNCWNYLAATFPVSDWDPSFFATDLGDVFVLFFLFCFFLFSEIHHLSRAVSGTRRIRKCRLFALGKQFRSSLHWCLQITLWGWWRMFVWFITPLSVWRRGSLMGFSGDGAVHHWGSAGDLLEYGAVCLFVKIFPPEWSSCGE